MPMNKQLAVITKATLEIKERGILNFWLYVEYEDGGQQGVGGYALDEWSEAKGCRVGTAYGCEMIRRLLLVLNVNDFSEMKGKHLWVLGEGDGLLFQPKGIQALNLAKTDTAPIIFGDLTC
jgi:hypothetical protein